MRAIVVSVFVAFGPTLAAQGLLDFEGTWVGSCPDCAPGAMRGGVGKTLVIRVSGSEISIQRDGFPAEVYRLDGTDMQLPDGRTATATVQQESLVLTTVRRRARSRDEVYQTIMHSTYRVSANTLTIDRSTRAVRPDEPASDKWVSLGTVVYQRN